MSSRSRTTLLLVTVTALVLAVMPAQADHAWGSYHWARTANPFTLELGDNVDSTWDSYLATASTDWSASSVLDTVIEPGNTRPRQCRTTTGRVEVCNAAYGFTGWLGVAGISIRGDHIQAGYVKLNDSYFNSSTYDTPAWRNLVMCQEIGHTFGLGHNDEDFSTTNGTCMDYSNDPEPNQHPDAHDYAQLETIYRHLDSTNSWISSGDGGTDDGDGGGPPAGKGGGKNKNTSSDAGLWGREVASNGHSSTFVRQDGDTTYVTHVTWAR